MIACPTCKAQNPDGSIFCSTCGKPIAGPAPAAPVGDLSGMNTIDPGILLSKPGPARSEEQVALEPGTVFADRYTIEQVVGRGGMGIVYRAKDSIGDRSVALKLIRSDLLGGDAAVKRLVTEGVLTQDIRHKNVVNVYNVGQVDGQPFVAMEFAGGTSLREWLRQQVTARTEVPLRIAARIVAEILDGLDAAHSMGIVHRDLKPENVMLTADPTDVAAPLKILDFGIARAANKFESGTGTGLGTPRYMAPEQITNPDAAGPSADLYSVSVMFYELLVDVLPQGHWQPPSGGRSDVSVGIDKLIERGLSNRPASRPQTAKEYRAELVAAVNNTAPAPPPRPTPAPVPTPTPAPAQVNTLYTSVDGKAPQVDWSNPFKTAWIKWTSIGCGGFLGLILLIAVIQAAIDGNKSPYADLNGRWELHPGLVFNATVQPNGMFTAVATTNDETVTMNGKFNGATGDFTLTGDGKSQPGTIRRFGDCDLQVTTVDAGSPSSVLLYVNHSSTEGCPTSSAKE